MEQDFVNKAVEDQFKRSLHMFRKGLEKFSQDEWRSGDPADRRPAALAYHLIETINFYVDNLPANQFPWGDRFQVDWETDDSARLPSKMQILEYLDETETKLTTWLVDVDLSAPEKVFLWTGKTILERAIYLLRHTQYHVGEISRELNVYGKTGPKWR